MKFRRTRSSICASCSRSRAAAWFSPPSRSSCRRLNQSELPKINEKFEEVTEGEEESRKEKLKTKWAALEALVGDPKRIDFIAADLVQHYEMPASVRGKITSALEMNEQ